MAERLHIEQPPLPYAIKELKFYSGVQFFEQTKRRMRLKWADKDFRRGTSHRRSYQLSQSLREKGIEQAITVLQKFA